MPPSRTGVAAYSAEMVASLAADHTIDVFVDGSAAPVQTSSGARSAHDFLWLNHLNPYDLTVYQLGNSAAHDYQWPYVFRFPGLVVLHDAHLHHARAATLLLRGRANDYRAEFAASQLDTSVDMAELAVTGFDSHLYYSWPMTRLVALASRLTAVHSRLLAESVRADAPGARVEPIRLAHGTRVDGEAAAAASARVRARHKLEPQDVVFGVFGGLTIEKRIPQVLSAFAALLPYIPAARLVLVGEPAPYYDLRGDIDRAGLRDRVIVTGFVENDELFTEYVAGCDVSINLRWPTAREVSGPWVRALAAGRPTITVDLAHTADIPALDPRTWTVPQSLSEREPVTVSIDILDEDHSLRTAMRRLATDTALRERLGRAAAAYWEREHSMSAAIEDYCRVLAAAQQWPVAPPPLPAHLRTSGGERLQQLLEPFGLSANVWSKI
jgi:glycosyltransferase involved in cell wall biosynthesis